MKAVAIVIALTFGYILFGQIGSVGRQPRSANPYVSKYELTAKTEIKQGGIRAYAETVYTYTEVRPDGARREKWRITQQDKYARHWISPNGTVFVMTDSMPGPGGSGAIWARDPFADIKGIWPGFGPFDGSQSGFDFQKSEAVSLTGGADQLRLKLTDGSEHRYTVIYASSGNLAIHRKLAKGEADLLTETLDKPQSSFDIVFERIPETNFGVWRLSVGGNPVLIRQALKDSQRNGFLEVASEDVIAQIPTRVVRMPSGKILWFEFSEFSYPGVANLKVLDYTGAQLASVDLLKLGGFVNGDAARKSIKYGDVIWNGGSGDMPVETNQRYGGVANESIKFEDRTGRKYLVSLESRGDAYVVDAKASMNLGRATEPKEPSFPGATLSADQRATSSDGKFSATAKTYEDKGKLLTQITLTAHIVDPVEGGKSVQLFSVPMSSRVEGLRVSDSGRVFGVSYIAGQQVGDKKMDMCLFHSWEPSGRNMNFDLLRLKWFLTLAEARAQLNMAGFKMTPEGVRGERQVDGVPVPTYPLETLTFNLKSGKTENLFIGYVNDHMPTIFYSKRPKSLPGSG